MASRLPMVRTSVSRNDATKNWSLTVINGDERVICFSPNQALPEGWFVIQLDSGHYMGTDGGHDTAITVNRFHARKWAIALSKEPDRAE